jgi:hypothetical protein
MQHPNEGYNKHSGSMNIINCMSDCVTMGFDIRLSNLIPVGGAENPAVLRWERKSNPEHIDYGILILDYHFQGPRRYLNK